ANLENVVDAGIWKDLEQRRFIQDKIDGIIQNNTFENKLFEVINSLIKDCKVNESYYSKEAESIYLKELEQKLKATFKYYDINNKTEQEDIINELFVVFIEQLKAYKYLKIKRLDEKVLEFLNGENEDGEVFCSDKKQLKKLY